MKAIRYYTYGSPDVLQLQDVEIPAIGGDDLLVRVRAASVNPLDWHFMRGMPYVVRLIAGVATPKASTGRLGADMAGSVEAVGRRVTSFKPAMRYSAAWRSAAPLPSTSPSARTGQC